MSMEQKDKQLLLRVLSMMLPYDVIVHIRYESGEPCYSKLSALDIDWFINSKIKIINPYLRPMSSMTEEESREYNMHLHGITVGVDAMNLMIWICQHHLDICGLIPRGLALHAPEGMYK